MVSLTDVAQHARVSIATVSRAISHPEKLAPETLALVQAGLVRRRHDGVPR